MNSPQIGLVAIGRNEGKRLEACLNSVIGQVTNIVYVDSGSTDDSVNMAKSLGVEVVNLDLSIPFTAARSRNAGLERLLAINPQVEFVQFVDGDCAIADDWLTAARQVLETKPTVAVVCGRRRERFPAQSIYNKLCDIEWQTPIGEAKYCGGDALMRIEALQQVAGFNPQLIAGEEPELCVRLRQNNWQILRIDHEMTLHDAQMFAFGQWWKRSLRSGHAYAEGNWLHGQPPEYHWVKETRSIWLWGLLLPAIALILAPFTRGLSLLIVLAGYLLITYKTYNYYHKNRNFPRQDALLYAFFCVLAKFPQMFGQVKFHLGRWQGKQQQLIEYKN
jgi:glycosyltransferase involved in cell wall biosynthesis